MAIETRQLFNFIQGSDITGESAYDIWKRLGNPGTEADFLEFIKSGPKGEKGDPGDSAASYGLAVSDTVIKKDINNVLLPASITFSAYYRIGTDTTRNEYLGKFVILEGTADDNWQNKYASESKESTVTYIPSNNAAFVKCILYSADDNTVELDTQSVAILSEVKPDDLEVLSAILSNDAHVVATDGNGENGDFSECVTSIQVFSGIRDVSAECTYEVSASEGLTGTWDLSSYTYSVTALTVDTGYVDIIATYNSITVTKRFSISKTKFGKSAYELWLEIEGNEGKTEEEFIYETIDKSVEEANAYTDEKIAAEVVAREAGDTNTLASANAYTDEKIANINIATDSVVTKDSTNLITSGAVYEAVNGVKTEFALKDVENGYTYIVQMRNGSLVSYCVCNGISVTTLPDKMSYSEGEEFDPTGMVVSATCEDGSTRVVSGYTYEVADTIVTISYSEGGNVYTTTIEFEIGVDIESLLSADFGYTDNGDGTYTINSWNGTLNGETSTELVIPDSDKIII